MSGVGAGQKGIHESDAHALHPTDPNANGNRLELYRILWLIGCLSMPALPLVVLCIEQSLREGSSFLELMRAFLFGYLHIVLITQFDLLVVTYLILALCYLKLSRRLSLFVLLIGMLNYATIGYVVMYGRFEGGLERLFFLIPWRDWIR